MSNNTNQSGRYRVRFIKPTNKLKQKVGAGGIEKNRLKKAQENIENSELDFLSYAEAFLKQMSENRKQLQQDGSNDKSTLIGPVMQLKANGGMFQYQLISDVADSALQFLESIESMDNDAFEVIKAHENTIRVVVTNNLKGDGGQEGAALVKELQKACQRYLAKQKNLQND